MPIPLAPVAATDPTGPGAPGSILHDGLVLLGDVILGVTDDNGVEWILESLKGWSDSTASTGSVEQRASAHGGWVSSAYYAPRIIELEGSLVADNWDGVEAAVDRLMSAIPLGTLAPLYVATNTRTLQALVRQEGDPLVDILGGWARFSLSLLAPDPRRYSESTSSAGTNLPFTTGGLSLPLVLPLSIGAVSNAGRLQAVNEGNMPTSPTLTIYGPCSPSTITHLGSGRQLQIIDPVPAGRALVLDVDTRTAVLDGTAPRAVTGSWFDLDPGVNDIAFNATVHDPASLLEVTFRSAWR